MKSTADIEFVQTLELTVDGIKHTFGQNDILLMSHVGQEGLTLSAMSEKKNIQFSFFVYAGDLKPGTYKVYNCKGPSICEKDLAHENEDVIYGPYPKDPMPPLSSYRIAYNAPSLGLAPLDLVITSVSDEQQQGNPWKTKRVKGEFGGTLANVEKQDQNWHIEGATTKVAGKFDLYCTIR